MALTVYQNVASLNSQRYLGINQTAMSTSIERLSSGLRINHAADDASGLAISEKLRGQITGLERASMNAQDGISMLQTAEGALDEVSSMLQRMRELAVQAANGTYTSNDRTEIQKEVEQLKAEIDRISTATEFNTKKLLNGDGTALWSSSSSNIEAIIRDEVAEGNYKINLETIAGDNQVYKTDIMTLNDDVIGTEIVTAGGDVNDTNVASVSDAASLAASGSSYYTVTVGDITAAGTASVETVGSYLQAGSMFSVSSASVTTTITSSGYFEVKFTDNITSASSTTATYAAMVRYIDASTGWTGEWVQVDVSSSGTIVSIDSASATMANLVNSAGSSLAFNLDIAIGSSGSVQDGDKVLLALTGATDVAAVDIASSGGGTIKITGGPLSQNGPTIHYTAINSLTGPDNGDYFVDTTDVEVYYATINSDTGNLDIGSLVINFKETDNLGTGSAGMTMTGDFSLKVTGAGEAAASTTKLKDISVFTDSDGNNLFDNKQELTVWGNGTSATIYLEADDTIADLEEKLTNAIVNDLGMGSDNNTVNSHLVDYVSVATSSGDQSVEGTFIIQTALTGEQGEIAFSGDEDLINALSLNVIQEAENNTTKVTVYDAHTGELIGTDETGNDRVYGIIDGVEIVLDSRAGVNESWDDVNSNVVFSTNEDVANEEYFLHIVDNSTDLQIGANAGQTLAVSIPQLDVTGLGLDNLTLVSQELAQAAIPDIDAAIDMVVSVRATIGAQVNRLEYTINNLDTANENMTAAESRIRDLDMAEEMSTYTQYQVLTQAGISMLAQANSVPQMALQLLQ